MALVPSSRLAPPPGDHGGDGARLAAVLGIDPSAVLDLSVSLNPCAPDVAAMAAGHLDALGRYPDPSAATAAVASALGVDPDRVVLTNGGAEAIALLAAHLGEGWVEPPDFSLYARHLPSLVPGSGRWRSNPRSPTGELGAAGDEAAVWDEAFWPLATGTWTRGDADRGAFVVGSLTKTFACPGLRAGYVLCPDGSTAYRLRLRAVAWSVSGLAAAVVPALIAAADVPAWARAVRRLRAELAGLLGAHGYSVLAADAPWVLVPDAGDLRERLARHAVLVRDCASFGLAGTVRIGVPDEQGLERLDGALRRSG